uniref:Uncharacterized protein n=1 Tax=Grammatophora oceanica TaxID=210454 RepID=A0A7S1UNC8_9STRA|mmetsp:Transcript_14133/g.20712  ORF Transcript_14133/g.20712 Transcript_14133/m.20712 type:complete len:505 (+) Transcript_14133:184-1698(+)|eukprot:CAMPEP_0194036452 /NCGR_PEP_ID=MMETSP0009_2-20130614/8789_1 /TAXON_ID=210454 /ORGANISM="Grammatophora oceanica, Strain CCMP 410" /LENGTH=504 /DNA_ID=CAMNT_0038678199 /DNA_START=110 /DNA_END=1624 /DNA_ORIENTATION=+
MQSLLGSAPPSPNGSVTSGSVSGQESVDSSTKDRIALEKMGLSTGGSTGPPSEELAGELGILMRSIQDFDDFSTGEAVEVYSSTQIAGVTSQSREPLYGYPLTPQRAKELFPSDAEHKGLVWNATLVPNEFFNAQGKLRNGLLRQDFDHESKTIKPRRATLPVTQLDFLSSLTKIDGENRWVFNGVLNGWPAIRQLELQSLEKKRVGSMATPKDIVTGQMKWIQHWRSDKDGKAGVTPASVLDPNCVYRAKLTAQPWTKKGWSQDSPGFLFWYQYHHPSGPRVDFGTSALKTVGDAQCTTVHMFSHRYAVGSRKETPRDKLTYHSVALLEWDHGKFMTVVEVAFLNGIGGYNGRSNFYHDRDEPVNGLYKALPPEMISPWLATDAEIRCYDVESKNLDEFKEFVAQYEGQDKRFVDPQFSFSHPVRLTFRSRGHICQYLLNYIRRDTSYNELRRNCQTLSADLCGFLAGKKDIVPFHPVSRIDFRSRTYLFLYDSSMYNKSKHT